VLNLVKLANHEYDGILLMIRKYEILKLFLDHKKLNNDYDEIPAIFIELLISAEDHRFHLHNGVDAIAIIRAVYKTIFHRSVQGGSTISMQLVRVITGSYERSLARKLQEIILATKLNNLISKDDISRIYLSTAYFGWQMNGIHAACKRQNVDINNVTIFEAAEIIARLKYPEPRSPSYQRIDKIKGRAKHIINRHNMLIAKRANQLDGGCIVDGRI
jgi:membrane peptidoglycan carboxypeptidase